jgi:hypothetical protein
MPLATAEGALHLRDSNGVVHQALRPNDEDAWWTPIMCGDGINLPGSQTEEPITCVVCASLTT